MAEVKFLLWTHICVDAKLFLCLYRLQTSKKMELPRVLVGFLVRDQPNCLPCQNDDQPMTPARDPDLFQPLQDSHFQ